MWVLGTSVLGTWVLGTAGLVVAPHPSARAVLRPGAGPGQAGLTGLAGTPGRGGLGELVLSLGVGDGGYECRMHGLSSLRGPLGTARQYSDSP